MNIAIIGAGPAGIISARNAIKAGHSVVLFEKNTRIGGSGTLGVVALTVMPVCRTLVIHFIILAFPGDIDEFPWSGTGIQISFGRGRRGCPP